MTRKALIEVYLDFWNNFLTVGRFAEVYGLHESEAEALISVARLAFNTPHPEA